MVGEYCGVDHAFAGIMVGADKTALAWGHKDYGGLVPPEFACAISEMLKQFTPLMILSRR